MAYEDFEDRETGLDRSAELYDDSYYEDIDFGEQLDPLSSSNDAIEDVTDDYLLVNNPDEFPENAENPPGNTSTSQNGKT